MLVYNTTYTMPVSDARGFVVWVHEVLIPRAEASGLMQKPRLLRILSHKEEDSECFSVQFDVEDTRALHLWYTREGHALGEEMTRIFDGRIVGFPTMMEVIE